MKNTSMKSFSDSKNVKYTSVNLAFCALVVAIVMVVNAMITIFSVTYNWRLDMTGEKIFTMSDQMHDAVEDVFEDSDVQIEIIFASPEDVVKDAFATTDSAGCIGYVNATAKDLSVKFSDNIKLTYKNIRRDYNFFKDNFYSESGTPLSPDVVIVARKNADGTYGEYRVLNYNTFYTYSSNTGNLYAYNGEMVFTSAILGLALDKNPTVYFTYGHGEDSFTAWDKNKHEAVDSENIVSYANLDKDAYQLMKIFIDNGFVVKGINLLYENIPSDARAIVINQPMSDFYEAETEKLREYYRASGTVFCFTSHNNNDLTTLYEFAQAECGVTVERLPDGVESVKDSSTLIAGAVTGKPMYQAVVPNNAATTQYFKTLGGVASPKAIYSDANVIKINDLYKADEGYEEQEYVKFAKPVLVTTENAMLGSEKGVYNLVTVTAMVKTNQENIKENYSYFVMCPTASFVSNENLIKSQAQNNKMMQGLVHTLAAREDTPSLVDIDFKTFLNYDLDITETQARTVTILISTVVPLAFIVCGTVIIRRRKLR